MKKFLSLWVPARVTGLVLLTAVALGLAARATAAELPATPKSPPTTEQAQRPRLGLNLQVVEAIPGIPAENVGKLVVASVQPGSLSEKAGLKQGDILLKLNSTEITSFGAFRSKVASLPLNKNVEITYARGGKKATASILYK